MLSLIEFEPAKPSDSIEVILQMPKRAERPPHGAPVGNSGVEPPREQGLGEAVTGEPAPTQPTEKAAFPGIHKVEAVATVGQAPFKGPPVPTQITDNGDGSRGGEVNFDVEERLEEGEVPGDELSKQDVEPLEALSADPLRELWSTERQSTPDLKSPISDTKTGPRFVDGQPIYAPSSGAQISKLLRGGPGTGLVTGQALQDRVQGIASIDAKIITAQHRADMGLAAPVVGTLTQQVKAQFDEPTLHQIEGLGIKSKSEQSLMLSENLVNMMIQDAQGIGAPMGSPEQLIAQANMRSAVCTFRYFELGWVSMRLEPDGHVVGATMYRSSGSPRVDDYVLETVQSVHNYGEVPEEALAMDGSFVGTWEVGYRDYANSTCKSIGQTVDEMNHMVVLYKGAFF